MLRFLLLTGCASLATTAYCGGYSLLQGSSSCVLESCLNPEGYSAQTRDYYNTTTLNHLVSPELQRPAPTQGAATVSFDPSHIATGATGIRPIDVEHKVTNSSGKSSAGSELLQGVVNSVTKSKSK